MRYFRRLSLLFAAFVFNALAFAYPQFVQAGGQPASGEDQTIGDVSWEQRYPSTPLPKVGRGTFKVTAAGGDSGFVQNKLQKLTVMVTRPDGQPVTDARISVTGKARDVVRRMPTAPQITENLGGGKYLVEGLRFNMAGSWLLEFQIESGADKDKTLLEVEAR